ncbi:MAG TPA: ABC transporter substrate-binding protein [Methanospirillum sp.]|uniref:ABC transporter substrate-binding protein n=1 Tax=Methanospirillum sp. TaxID=45200 RepID=UPI002C0D05AD|nr:ABC transporter substrate-binding protein [Methanospirillum sp.]HWQ65175.1 ABC transporter substrate-binding protein [Methanospirillum sp.]
MNRKLKVLFIAMMLVAAVFLSGCIGSDSAKESDSSSGNITEKINPVTEKENSSNDKLMRGAEDIGSNGTNDGTPINSSNVTNNTSNTASYSDNNVSSSTHHSSSDHPSSSSSSQASNSDDSDDTVEITDVVGRTVTIPTPENIDKVSCLHPIPTYMTWRLAPDKLNSIDMVFSANPRLVPEDANETLNSLPVTGVFFKGMNQEQMLALDPDVIVSMTKDPNLDQEQTDYAAPVVAISKDNLTDYEQSFRLMGEVLGNEEEANELADYWNDSINKVTDITSTIPEDQSVKVYYASHDGPLSTVGPLTVMSSIIDLAGGVDMYDTNTSLTSAQKVDEHLVVNIEQVLLWNPDVIITKTETEKNTILNDTQWQSINAVKNGRVCAAPRWESLDGIQSIMGLMWTAEKLYPDKVTFDFNNETREFYSEFYLYDNITDEKIAETVV